MGPYPWAEILLFKLLHTVALYPTRQLIHRPVVLAAMVYVATQIFLRMEIAEPLGIGYGVGFQIALHFELIAHLLCAEGPFPDHWRRVRDDLEVHAKTEG